jgi:FkbM family methyltransferase
MHVLRSAKAAVVGAIRRMGFEIVPRSTAPTMDAALGRMAGRVDVRTVIDVGASDGRWTLAAMRHFPRARYLLVEAQEAAHGEALRKLAGRDPRVEIALAAAGEREGEAHFDASSPLGGAVRIAATSEQDIVVPVTTIDDEVRRRRMEPPYLVKLDTHGHEVAILEGARQTLAAVSLLVVEAYNFDIGGGALRFPQMCRYLEERGFRCADLADPMWRPGDEFLWQMDLFFVPGARPEFASNDYEQSGDR